MEITIMMAWGAFVAVFSVVVGVVLARSLANKDVLVNKETLKYILAPLELTADHILEKCNSMENRISNLEAVRDDKSRIQRS